jgi:hypothetical protein
MNTTQPSLPRVNVSERHEPAYQAYQLLHVAFVAAPVIAGLDKFAQLLTNWDQYLAPQMQSILGANTHTFMLVVGVVEVIAGLIVALKPKIGAYIVGAWLAAIIVNLLLTGKYYDIALRDFGLFLGAIALGRLSMTFDHQLEGRHAWRSST